MKVRNGFVSNSSSSSFIITGKDNIEKAKFIIDSDRYTQSDYYQIGDVLYTSIISDGECIYNYLYDLASTDVNCGHSYPYDEENFVEFEGERGVDTVYIEECNLPDYISPEVKGKKLYEELKKFINYTEMTEKDFNELCKKDEYKDLLYFLGKLLNIVGWYKE